MIITTKY